ncbi:MAG: MarR family transcriptional regulator [Rhodococcus sp.]|nr:MarR family transcriptional regulator [Rhodococcus sp. (in: high G+C Gram-positive bacteria)]
MAYDDRDLAERAGRLREDFVVFNRKMRTKSSGHLLTPTQLQALSHLDRVGPMTARTLADREQVTPQTIARTVAFLEEQGMVSRTTDPNDARAALITVTSAGRRTLNMDRDKRNRWLAQALEKTCTPVERELLFLAGELFRRIAEEADAPSGSAPSENR